MKTNLSRRDPPGRLNQPHDGQRRQGFAAAGFPDEAECFARRDAEADIDHRRHEPSVLIEAGGEVGHGKKRSSGFGVRRSGLANRARHVQYRLRSPIPDRRVAESQTSTSLCSPKTDRMASAISPTVALASTARTIGGTRLSEPRAAATTSIEGRPPRACVAGGPDRADALHLPALDLRIEAHDLDAGGGVGREGIDADDRALDGVDLLLCAIRGLLDGALDQALLDCRERSTGGLDPLEQARRRPLRSRS